MAEGSPEALLAYANAKERMGTPVKALLRRTAKAAYRGDTDVIRNNMVEIRRYALGSPVSVEDSLFSGLARAHDYENRLIDFAERKGKAKRSPAAKAGAPDKAKVKPPT